MHRVILIASAAKAPARTFAGTLLPRRRSGGRARRAGAGASLGGQEARQAGQPSWWHLQVIYKQCHYSSTCKESTRLMCPSHLMWNFLYRMQSRIVLRSMTAILTAASGTTAAGDSGRAAQAHPWVCKRAQYSYDLLLSSLT